MSAERSRIKVTIVIVCYNAEVAIETSLRSLTNQKYRNYEVIIVDGNSDDNTLKIVNQWRDNIEKCMIISEPDRGIYDAMNKGVRFSKGKYIYFLNAGDRFYSAETLKNVERSLNGKWDVVYGNMIYGGLLRKYPKKISKWFFLSEKMICHQAIFAKKSLFVENKFSEKYGLCADRYWLYQCFIKGNKMLHIDEVIGYYDTTGKSSNIKHFKKDSIKVIKDQFGLLGILYVKFKRFFGVFRYLLDDVNI